MDGKTDILKELDGDDQKIRSYVLEITGVPIDANTDPTDFLIASHAALRAGTAHLKAALELLEPASEWMSQDDLEWWEKYEALLGRVKSAAKI
jgi:hypothetical protein